MGELGGEQFYEAAATKLGEIDAVVGADVTAATSLAIDLKGTEDIDVVVEVAGLEAQDNLITASLGHDELHSLPLWND